MAGGTIATDPDLADRRADQGAGCGVMTAGTGVMGFRCSTDQGVIVAARTAVRTNRNKPLWSKS